MLRKTVVITTLVAVVGTSCASPEQSVVPTTPARSLLGIATQPTTSLARPLARTTPLSSDVTWTFTAGPAGAVSSNPAVGLTIYIPAGALSSEQQITVTAPAGSAVAYEFSPHLVFSQSVTLSQSLDGTNWSLLSLTLTGGHFADDSLTLTSDGLALVDELVPAIMDLFSRTARLDVGHFSGWIIATGRDGDAGDSTSSGQ